MAFLFRTQTWTRQAAQKARQYHLTQRISRSYSQAALTTGGDSVRIVEAGARDGLQNVHESIPTATKVELLQQLASTGLSHIEATSFVSPKWVPQLSDGASMMQQILPLINEGFVRFPVLVPNMKGLENAIRSGAKEISIGVSATEAFSKANFNATVEQSLQTVAKVVEAAIQQGIAVRGGVSCVVADPFSGPTDPENVTRAVKQLLDMGCYEVLLGDTLGVGTPRTIEILLNHILRHIPAEKLAGHYHDTYGQGVANVVKSFDMGLRVFDSSVAGLGGCPFAPGAKGNVATEDIVYTFENSGIRTGVDLDRLVATGEWISRQLHIPYSSRAGVALFASRAQKESAGSGGGPTSHSTAARSSKSPQTTASADGASKTDQPPAKNWQLIEDAGSYQVRQADNACKVTLSRPKNGNALTHGMVDGLTKVFERLKNDKAIFHVILDAEGKYFCTGMDLSSDGQSQTSENAETNFEKVVRLFDLIDQLPQTTIAVINGPCFGGGVGLGFCCDIRLASDKARWTLSEVKLGVIPAIISKFILREWSVPYAREAILSGREVSPDELQRIGAVHGVATSSATLDSMLEAKLVQLQKCAPQASSRCKELVRLGWDKPESPEQRDLIKSTFLAMTGPGSEGSHGISQFQQNRNQVVDWSKFWRDQGSLPV